MLLRWALNRIQRRTLYNKIDEKGAKAKSKKCKKMQEKLNIKQFNDKGCQADIIALDYPLCSNSHYENLCDLHDLIDLKYSGKWTDDIMEEWWFNKQAYPCMYEGIRSQLEQANVIKYYNDRKNRKMQLEQEEKKR